MVLAAIASQRVCSSWRLVMQRFDTNGYAALTQVFDLKLRRRLGVRTALEGYLFVPSVQFRAEGEDAAQLLVKVAMNGKAFSFFPELNRANLSPEITRDFLPGIQTASIATRSIGLRSVRRCRHQLFIHEGQRNLNERSSCSL